MTTEQINALSQLVEDVRKLAYGYERSTNADVRGKLYRDMEEVERLFPLRRRGLNGAWLPIEQPDTFNASHVLDADEAEAALERFRPMP